MSSYIFLQLILYRSSRNVPNTSSRAKSKLCFYIIPPLSSSSILVDQKTPYTISPFQSTIPCKIVRSSSLLDHNYFNLLSPSLSNDFDAFKTSLSQLQPPFLILGDFNCRHTLRGNLALLNPNHPTHLDMRPYLFHALSFSLISP